MDDTGEPSSQPTAVKLSVSDTGRGMDEELQTKIFEPFFSTKEENEATGLGLSTVYGIATQIGGTVMVTSAVGEGTRFDITIPLCDDPSTASRPEASAPGPRSGPAPVEPEPEPTRLPRRGCVLLVEDSVSLRSLLAEALVEEGYEVLAAQDSQDALRITSERREDIDVLVADVVLPDLDGWELAARLAAVRPRLRVLFMSGYASEPAPSDDRLAGVTTDFLAKPFTPLEMREALARLLSPV